MQLEIVESLLLVSEKYLIVFSGYIEYLFNWEESNHNLGLKSIVGLGEPC